MNPKYLLTAIALVLALVAGVSTFRMFDSSPAESQPAAMTAMILPDSRELPDFSLLDQRGEAAGREIFAGHWNLVFFGFTNCPDICPMTLQVLKEAKQQLAASGFTPLPRIVLVSVDPERDTPEKLEQYLSFFGEGNLGLTGEIEEVRKLTKDLGIFFEKRASDSENYAVDHSAVVLLINPEGRFHGLFSSPHEIANFVRDLPIIMAAS